MNLNPDQWIRRLVPLRPKAVLAVGDVAAALREQLLSREPSELTDLRAIAGAGLLLIVGPEASLGWVDGVRYLGQDVDAPRLLLPTTHRPPVHGALLQAALPGPTAVSLFPALLVPLADLRPLHRPSLEAWHP